MTKLSLVKFGSALIFISQVFCTQAQSTYTWKSGNAYSTKEHLNEREQLYAVHTKDGISGGVLLGGMTVDGRFYGQAVAIQNGGRGQLDFDATDCYLLLADGVKVSAINEIELEKYEKHQKRKQFFNDLANSTLDRMNTNSAARLGADGYTQAQMAAQSAIDGDMRDATLLHSLDQINERSLMSAGLQPGENASGFVYFEIPKNEQNTDIVGIGMQVGSDQMYFAYSQ
jgi:hypothetical protein